jgi:ATP-dependent Clp protease ATP-binding subunit ClpC
MPSSRNRRRLEVPTYFYDALKQIAAAEDRTVANVLNELLFRALRDYRPVWKPDQHMRHLTQRARRVVERAQSEVSVSFGHSNVGTEHLLLAMAEEADSLAARALAGYAITPQVVRDEIEARIGRGDASAAEPRELAAGARAVLALAVDEASRLDHSFVGTGHLLLGLVRHGQGIAAGVLIRRGVDLEDLRDAVLQVLARGDTPRAQT